ncbi:MAG: DUF6350 family protein [Nocardioidaceae bacterium]
MTDLMSRPILRVKATSEGPQRPIALSATLAAAVCAGVGLLTCVLIAVGTWFGGSTGSFAGAVRVGASAWLLSNASGVVVGDVAITGIPVGLLAVCAWLLYRGGWWAGAHSAVRRGRDLTAGAVLMAVVYAAVGAVVASVARAGGAHTEIVRTLVATGALGLVFGGLGLVRGSQSSATLVSMMPAEPRAAATGGLVGVMTMIVAGSVLVTVALVTHFSDVLTLSEGLGAGRVGGGVMALLGMAAVPNAVLCAGSFIAGPGFVLGTGTAVAPGNVTLGSLPGFPLLGIVPSRADAWWETALIGIPVLAGGLAGFVAVRRYPVFGLGQAALRGGLAGLLGGVCFGASTWLATGGIGPGRMQDIGPDVPATTLVCAVAMTLGGAVSAMATRWWQSARAR